MNEHTPAPTQSRRAVMRAGMGLLGTVAAASVAGTRTARADQKLAQSAVQYQTHPKDGQLCSICVNFVAPKACTIVDGEIKPTGWCVAFAPKA